MYKIITDSGCDLPNEKINNDSIDFIPMEVIINDETFWDDNGQTMNTEKFYEDLKNNVLPKTTQINVFRYEQFSQSYVEKNIPIIYICFSSGMSGSYQNALLATEMIKEETPNAEIYVLNSLSASGGQGMIVLDALNNLKSGMSFNENIEWLEDRQADYEHWAVVDDLEYLYHGGRLNKRSAFIGELLNVKPILTINEEGTLVVHDKVRTRTRALSTIAKKIVQVLNASQNPSEKTIIITSSGDFKNAQLLKEKILDKATPKEVLISEIGATVSSHTGFGCVAAFVRQSE